MSENIEAIAQSAGRRPSEIAVAVLDRERHEDLIEDIRETGPGYRSARREISRRPSP